MHYLEEDQGEYLLSDDEQIETLHVYVYKEEPKKPMPQYIHDRILAGCIIMTYILAGIIAVGFISLIPSPSTVTTLQVPALYLPLKTYTAKAPIIPTGTKTIPATTATGTLTIYNGSILSHELPAGLILTGKDGVEIVTDQAVTIPAGSAPSYGIATVSAHAVVPGAQGNIQADDISAVYNSDITIKNLSSFTGGADARTETFVTAGDTHTALTKAQYALSAQEKQHEGLLARPCQEKTEQKALALAVTRACQFVTYTAPPGVQVVSAQVKGKVVLLQVKMVTRPHPFIGK